MLPILVGLETEYGFTVEDHGASEQIDNAMILVRGLPGENFVGWDYSFEFPRGDLRGFQVDQLNYDPEDAAFDQGKVRPADREVRSDRVLPNGARFYNDHGHPEYSTPECRGVAELALQDLAGDEVVLAAAKAFEVSSGKAVRVYKNNSDGHGSSYGTHESYLAPRSWGFERLYRAVVPILVTRQVVCGSGKVGSEVGSHCDFQISQRADFFTEKASIDTLYRRPVFNTRDEPHAEPADWIRLHVICGDANRMHRATQRKVALVKLALWLEEIGQTPTWSLADPVSAFKAVSRDLTCQGRIDLESGSWTTSLQILESYADAGERFLDSAETHVQETLALARESIELLQDWSNGGDKMASTVDWAAKLRMIQQFLDAESVEWTDPSAKSFDLAYHALDPEESLFTALQELGLADPYPAKSEVQMRVSDPQETTRAIARSVAVSRFLKELISVSWGRLGFETSTGRRNVALRPDVEYPRSLRETSSVEEFLFQLEALK